MKKKAGKKKGKSKTRKKSDDHPFSGLEAIKKRLTENPASPGSPEKAPGSSTEPKIPARVSPEFSSFGDEELDLEEAMEGVKPLIRDKPRVVRKPRSKSVSPGVRRISEDEKMLKEMGLWVDKKLDFKLAEDAERVEGAISGLDPRTRKKLRGGGFAVQDDLDLHGLTSEVAFQITQAFILNAVSKGYRCVLIVHGKGLHSKTNQPVLKQALKKWLTRGAIGRCVLAFATALPCDGGNGATYALLRKSLATGDGKKAILTQE